MTRHTFHLKSENCAIAIAARIHRRGNPWILCIHGLQSNRTLFDQMFQDPAFASYALLALDLPGFGESSNPSAFSYDLQAHADACVAVVRQLAITSLHIIGHSLGGMIGVLLLEPLHDVVRSLVNMEGNLTAADCGLSAEIARQSFETFQQQPRTNPTADALAFYRTAQSIARWAASEDLLGRFNAASVPTLYVHGERNAHKAQLLTTAQVASIPEAGHFLLRDNPEATYRALHAFLAAGIPKGTEDL